MRQAPRKTSITLSPESIRAYELAKSLDPHISLTNYVDRAIQFYARYGEEPCFDVLLTLVQDVHGKVTSIASTLRVTPITDMPRARPEEPGTEPVTPVTSEPKRGRWRWKRNGQEEHW
jgi:hypothetical protein